MRNNIDFLKVGRPLASLALKGAVGGSEWSDLHGSLTADQAGRVILESLPGISVFDTLRPLASRAKLSTGIYVGDPITGSIVAENRPIPVRSGAIGSAILAPRKAAAIVVSTQESLSTPEGVEHLGKEMQLGIASATDGAFCDHLLNSSATVLPSLADPVSDLAALLPFVATTGAETLHLIVNPREAIALATHRGVGTGLTFPDCGPTGGQVCGCTVHSTAGVPAGTAILLDPRGVFVAGDDLIFALSESAQLAMSDSPESDEAPAIISVFQTDCLAIKATRAFGCQLMRSSSCAVLSGISWGDTAS